MRSVDKFPDMKLHYLSGTAWTLVSLGWWQSIMFVASLLGISHVLRTVLKGEFSDTSWFGQIMRGKVKFPPDGDL